jgi:toxin FitB
MIVLDTNVISEMMRPKPVARVVGWFAAQSPAALFTTALTQAEILYGMALLPQGKRRTALLAAANALFDHDFAGRLLPFDGDAAPHFAAIAAERRRLGRPISQTDAQIAAIARSRAARVATRNVRDFADCGVALVDPWDNNSL